MPELDPPVTVALVGVTGSGKTSLLNAIVGREFGLPGAAADTTSIISVVEVAPGFHLCDTPGVEGCEEHYETQTLQFLGLQQGNGLAVCRRTLSDGPCPHLREALSLSRCRQLGCSSLRPAHTFRPSIVVEMVAGHEGLNKSVLNFHRQLVAAHDPIVVLTVHRLPDPGRRRQAASDSEQRGLRNVLQLDCQGQPEGLTKLFATVSSRASKSLPWPDPPVTCRECHGAGRVACRCSSGQQLCPFCDGERYVRVWRSCPACDGVGKIPGWFSSSTCQQCLGAGQVYCWRPCDHCGQKGRVTCSYCAGASSVQCPSCRGTCIVPLSRISA